MHVLLSEVLVSAGMHTYGPCAGMWNAESMDHVL